jgi:hypothetical protein
MKLYKKILLGFGILFALLILISFFLPSQVHVERTAEIKAKPDTLFALINNLKSWNQWNPWNGMDPNWKLTYAGPESGVGAFYKWDSEVREVGKGSMLITVSKPSELIITQLDFGGHGTAIARFIFVPTSEGTKLTWTMDSDVGMNPVAKYFGLMMDNMVGKSYEKGLANLKGLTE